MTRSPDRSASLPAAPGVGYKAQHYSDIIADPRPVAWLEIHAENYMGAGGRPLAQLRALDCHYAQGFLFSRPMNAENATAFLAEDKSW